MVGFSFDKGDTNTDVRTHVHRIYASTTVKNYSKIKIIKLSQPFIGALKIRTITESPTDENHGEIE